MDTLQDILASRRMEQPPEIRIIQNFVQEKFGALVQVTIQQTQIVIGVKGSALAGALRPHLHELQALCDTDKRLLIRIQ